MFEGDTGRVATWADLMEGVCWADVIVVGELHGQGDIHRFQRALVEDTVTSFPGSVLSMEMLERDEQPLVDRWQAMRLDTETFIEETNSTNWAGKDSWGVSYQPILDAARDGGAGIVAANSPRRYVRQSRLQGYEAVAKLPQEEHAYFAFPKSLQMHGYSDRFASEMLEHSDGKATEEMIEDTFRAQAMWDATMARSIAEARSDGAVKVIHLVGRFHSDFDGGTIQEIRRRDPFARVLVVSCVESNADMLAKEDRGRADVVVYVRPTPPETPVSEEAEAENTTEDATTDEQIETSNQ